jgi:hypothetical protein
MINNLENLNVQELNAQEVKDVEGGFLLEFFLTFGVGYLVGKYLF